MRAYDASQPMLDVAAGSLRAMGLSNWLVQAADHRHIPAGDASADLIVSGWSFSYLSVWGDREQLEVGWNEIQRILRPGGLVILIESLGTGSETPVQLEHLKDYYAWLDEKGFSSKQISTDYRFDSIEEARELTGFFFGEAMSRNDLYLPEFTGLWWKRK
jgi:ubiquinone/menaquinone biosynthesis C-methylase UbiE